MSKMPKRSLAVELPMMKLALELTCRSSSENSNSQCIDFRDFKNRLICCLIDTSVLSDFIKPDGCVTARKRRDLEAFQSLVLMAEQRLITMSAPQSVLLEIQAANFSVNQIRRLNDFCRRVGLICQTTAFYAANGRPAFLVAQRPISAKFQDTDPSLSSEMWHAAQPDPSVAKEDREHYEMACVGRQPFITTDYRFVKNIASSIRRQIEIIEGRKSGRQIPKQRPALTAPAMTSSAYLDQLFHNFPLWRVSSDD